MENDRRFEQAEAQGKSFEELVETVASTEVTVIERLNPTNTKDAKAEFLESPDMVHPNYEYGNLDMDEASRNLETIEEVSEEIGESDLPDSRKKLLRYLAEDNRRKNDFVAANYEYNHAESEEEKAAAAEHHHAANEALYGVPDEGTFTALLQEKLDSIDYDALSDEDKKIYDELVAEIGPLESSSESRFKPKNETVERFAVLVHFFFEPFLDHIPEGKEEFSSQEMVDIINEIIVDEIGEDNPYRAEIKPDANNASANHETRRIYFPPEKTYSLERTKGLIVHELGTHVLRAIPYTDSEVAAFSMGFPGNEEFDEGVAKCVEQAINGRYEDSGIDHYINIGLANFKGKNFRQVYEIQMKLKHLTGEKSDTVFNAVQRCFRGTGELPNNKDLVYYNGANRVWKMIEEHIDDPELFDKLFLVGKIDIEEPTQESISYEARTKGI